MARGGSSRKTLRDPEDKRERTPNFTESEKDLLVAIVYEFRVVLESKKTDALTTKEKNETWELAAQAFNSRSGFVTRSAKNLKNLWGNLKGLAKAAASQQKSETFKTGGGSSKARDLSPRELQILEITRESGTGLESAFDGDRSSSSAVQQQVQEEEDCGAGAPAAVCTADSDDMIVLEFPDGEIPNMNFQNIQVPHSTPKMLSPHNWGSHAPRHLLLSKASALQISSPSTSSQEVPVTSQDVAAGTSQASPVSTLAKRKSDMEAELERSQKNKRRRPTLAQEDSSRGQLTVARLKAALALQESLETEKRLLEEEERRKKEEDLRNAREEERREALFNLEKQKRELELLKLKRDLGLD
ncbi:hypothetical protein FOCC_FOCC015414 [Frankliniella occidentalis]|uniref:Regulatory protein zeste n=1 Tax=Frankliniella occidentalis TaxID=133901 RepID=A0A9C6XT69_FRAOC|nr:uncharacterized protein LOC127751227 [Frankliniella occidentalis]KAE8739091.1 hypothetical protein FOCC_FOCC015414 [Frankliniella occidentalis]